MVEALGHVDFYPNGGEHQPGCTKICPIEPYCFSSNLLDMIIGSCSHHRSIDYYLESLHADQKAYIFISKFCKSWSHYLEDDCENQVDQLPMGEGLQLLNKYV